MPFMICSLVSIQPSIHPSIHPSRAGLVAGALEDCLVVAGGLEAVEPKRKVGRTRA